VNPAADKVRKLISLATSAAGTPEGDVARKMADKLLEKHGWTESDVSRRDHILIEQQLPEHEEWRRSLLILIAENADVAVVETPEGAGVHGVDVDIAPAILLFETLLRRIRIAASEFADETSLLMPQVASANRWYAGFSYWAIMGLLERLIAEEDEEDSEEDPEEEAPEVAGQIEGESEDDPRVVLPEDDETAEPPEWATLDEAEKAFEQLLEGDEIVLSYCKEGYEFGLEVPLTLGIGSAPEYDMPLLLEEQCEAS
jgi:hypothetical protein